MARPSLGWSFALPLAGDFHIPTRGFPGSAFDVTCFALVSSEARSFHPPTAQIAATNRMPTITQCDVRIGSPVLTIELNRSYRIEGFPFVYARTVIDIWWAAKRRSRKAPIRLMNSIPPTIH